MVNMLKISSRQVSKSLPWEKVIQPAQSSSKLLVSCHNSNGYHKPGNKCTQVAVACWVSWATILICHIALHKMIVHDYQINDLNWIEVNSPNLLYFTPEDNYYYFTFIKHFYLMTMQTMALNNGIKSNCVKNLLKALHSDHLREGSNLYFPHYKASTPTNQLPCPKVEQMIEYTDVAKPNEAPYEPRSSKWSC